VSVTLDGVGHHFPDGPVLFAGLSLVLEPGHTYAVVGPSGSGKSTLLAIIAGSVRPREGAVHRVGNDRIGWVHQNPLGSPRRTAMDHVVLALLLRGLTRSRAVAPARELLIDFGLVEIADQQLRTLSGGRHSA
jgi:lipoprotein-releasing system ATP-binding protein